MTAFPFVVMNAFQLDIPFGKAAIVERTASMGTQQSAAHFVNDRFWESKQSLGTTRLGRKRSSLARLIHPGVEFGLADVA
jgi:hypothetical protein